MNASRIAAVFVTTCLALLTSSAFAGPNGDRPVAARGVDLLAKALESVTDLSDQQRTDTKAILADAEAQLVALRDEAKSSEKGDRKAIRTKAAEILMGAKTQIESNLTEAQKPTFESALKSLREEAAKKRAERQKDGGKQKDGAKQKGGKKNRTDNGV